MLDCRRSNMFFKHAPVMESGSSESFASMRAPPGSQLYTASADVEACFYQCGIQEELSRYFCLPPVSGAEALRAGLTHWGDGEAIDSSVRGVSPALAVMPMGFSWAMWLMQGAHIHLIQRAGLPEHRIAYGCWPSPDLTSGIVEVPYCGNVTVVGLDPHEVTNWRDKLLAEFRKAGMVMHEISETESFATVLGSDLGGTSPTIRRHGPSLWLLCATLEWLKTGPVVTGRQLEVILRRGVHVPKSRLMYHEERPQVHCRPLLVADASLGLMPLRGVDDGSAHPLLASDLDQPFSDVVFASDASGSGAGVCRTRFDVQQVEKVACWNEKWRFRRLLPHEWAPRRRALGEFDEITDPRTVDASQADDGQWLCRGGFPEVPAEMLAPESGPLSMQGV